MIRRSQLRPGLDVFDAKGDKIGSVRDVGSDYVEVPTGLLELGRHLYIPMSAMDRVDVQGAYLNVARDSIPSSWEQRPTETAGSGAGTRYGTMPGSVAERAPQTSVTPEDVRGHDLCDVNGHRLGNISGVEPTYVEVATGVLDLGPRLFVPIDQIDHCAGTCCYLSVTTDEVKGKGWNRPPFPAATTGGRDVAHQTYRIPLREEQLEVHKHREQVGEVVIGTDVVEERRSIDVPVEIDAVTIERRPVDREVARSDAGRPIDSSGRGQTLRVPVYEERVDVEKRGRVREELVVEPEKVTRTEHVQDTVRREVAHVETTGEAGEFVHDETNLDEKPAEQEETKQEQRRANS